MTASVEMLAQIKNFFQLDFLFSGLEVSSTVIFAARIGTFLVLAAVVAYGGFRISMKLLEVIQTLISAVTRLPKSFFLLLILVIPLSPDSLGATWSGYIVFVLSAALLIILASALLIIWKYGVDQALRLIDRIRPAGDDSEKAPRETNLPPENSYGPLMNPPAA